MIGTVSPDRWSKQMRLFAIRALIFNSCPRFRKLRTSKWQFQTNLSAYARLWTLMVSVSKHHFLMIFERFRFPRKKNRSAEMVRKGLGSYGFLALQCLPFSLAESQRGRERSLETVILSACTAARPLKIKVQTQAYDPQAHTLSAKTLRVCQLLVQRQI